MSVLTNDKTRKFASYSSALLLSALLAACGNSGSSTSNDEEDGGSDNGGDTPVSSYSLSGSISGNNDNVTLSLNGESESFSGGAFTFTTELDEDTSYTILVASAPDSQSCTVSNEAGTITADVTDIAVICSDDAAQTYSIGGFISGNSADITLSLNGTSETFTGDDFTFTQALEDGAGYLVTFVSSEDDQVCSVENSAGTISADITNIDVTCSVVADRIDIYDGQIGVLEAGDFNGDGYVDVAFKLNPNGDHVLGDDGDTGYARVYYGNGDGSLSESIDIPLTGFNRARSGVRADIDGDGVDDYVSENRETIESFIGQEDNSFEDGTRWSSSTEENLTSVSQINMADMNKDGFDDLLVTIYGGSEVEFFAIYLNAGDGSFNEQVIPEFWLEDRSDVDEILDTTLADFNGDGDIDILSVISQDSSDDTYVGLYLATGNGDGTFERIGVIQTVSDDIFFGESVSRYEPNEMAYGDIDGDNDLDIALYSTTDYMMVLKNDGAANFSVFQNVTVGSSPLYTAFADMNADGEMDLVSLVSDVPSVVISYGQSDGTFGEIDGDDGEVEIFELEDTDSDSDTTSYFEGLEIVDMNMNGTPDIIFTEDVTYRLSPSGFYAARGSLRIMLDPSN